MPPSPIVLILGAGPRIGHSCALTFSAAGYNVALASRRLPPHHLNASGFLELRIDLSKPEDVPGVFSAVEAEFGAPPSVVIYNAASRTVLDASDPLSTLTLAQLHHDHAINILSPTIAAQHAVSGFSRLPPSSSRTFILTGNGLNKFPYPAVLTFGAGKAAAAHLIEGLVKGYGVRGYRFYYADERNGDGTSLIGGISGGWHAEVYGELAGDGRQREWEYMFVGGGDREFEAGAMFEVGGRVVLNE